jgi:hypothetical protein
MGRYRRGQVVNAPEPRERALEYAALGWRVFPIYEVIDLGEAGWKCACGDAECGRPGKHPRTKDGLNEATTDRVTIEGWWSRWPAANVGIATGRASNILVVDADCADGKPGVMNLTALSAKHGGMPNTPIVNSGSGGFHLYFIWNEHVKTGANVLGEAIDVRSDGGYIIAPPSRHYSGKQYEWRNDQADPITMPDWLRYAKSGGEEKAEKAKGRKRSQPGFKLEKLESMLKALDPDERELWLNVGVVMGRLYVGTGLEHDGWAVYETWAGRSEKFDEDRAGNLARMREMYYERSQEAPRAGGKPISIGTIIAAAKAAGWTPFGDRVCVPWEPGNEAAMTDALVAALVARRDNTMFEVMGEIVDVQRTRIPIMRVVKHAQERGLLPPEGLVVRRTVTPTVLGELSKCAVLETADKAGAPEAMPIAEKLGAMILKNHATDFQPLTGIATWPMVGPEGDLIAKARGYDPLTGLYFSIDPAVKIDERLKADAAVQWLREELLADFPFEDSADFAAALGMLLAFMQRPLLKTCPAFATVAPQIGTGKTTLVELGSLAIHGEAIAVHPLPKADEEFRKAIHSLLLAKLPAVLFDNIAKGEIVDSDHLAKLITAETAADRTLGASETRKQVNALLITMTGNNIAFGDDLASRVLPIRLNARAENPLKRKFKHHDIKKWVLGERNAALSALVAIARAGVRFNFPKNSDSSRFEDFDELIAKPVMAASGCDLRALMIENAEQQTDDGSAQAGALALLAKWQQKWRKEDNAKSWRTRDLVEAIDAQQFEEKDIKVLQDAAGAEAWAASRGHAIGTLLRGLNGDHRFKPLVLTSKADPTEKVARWLIQGTEEERRDATGF